MNKVFKLVCYSVIGLGLLAISNGCKEQPPEVTLKPDPPISRDVIDSYYYVKFGWGPNKSEDTIVMEVPDDTLAADFEWNNTRDYMQASLDYSHEYIRDSTDYENKMEQDEYIYAIGYTYAPATFLYNRGMELGFRDRETTFEEEYNKGDYDFELIDPEKEYKENEYGQYFHSMFSLTFPIAYYNDTLPYWDIEDYVYNASTEKGSVKWGRVGSELLDLGDTMPVVLNANAVDGVVISYYDENQIEWRTDNYPNFQNDSYFEITDRTLNSRDGVTYWIIEGEFAATLYNEIGAWKKCKAGEFRMRIVSDIELAPQPE